MSDKKINMYRTHQEAAGVAAKMTAEEELAEMEGWTDWLGAEEKNGYPFHADTPVEVKVCYWLGYDRMRIDKGLAKEFNWAYGPTSDGTVVAYRTTTPAELCERKVEQYRKTAPTQGGDNEPPSKYHVRNIWKDEEWIDFYMYYDQMKLGKSHQVGDSAIEHALKKLSQAGLRSGGKSKVQDIKEAIDSLEKALEIMERFGNERS